MPGMKNGMLIWNIGLTAVAGILLFLYFDGNKKSGIPKKVFFDTDATKTFIQDHKSTITKRMQNNQVREFKKGNNCLIIN